MIDIPQPLAMLPSVWQTVFDDWRGDSAYWIRHGLPRLAAILFIAFILIELLRAGTRRLNRFSQEKTLSGSLRAQQLRTLAGVINSVGTFIIIFVALMQVLPIFNVDVKPLLASAGIAGLAIGFGAQTLVKDVINGFFILVEDEYAVGDVVKIAGAQGTVEIMTLRRTVLRDTTGALHSVPNSEIKIITNLTRDWAQVAVHVAIAYSEDSERVISLLQDVGTELRNDERWMDSLVADPEVPGIDKVDGGQVDYLMVAKVKPGQQFAVSRELRRRIKLTLQRNNIKAAGQTPTYILKDSGQ